MKTVAITGSSGFVGTNLLRVFEDKGYKVIPITRDIIKDNKKLTETIEETDLLINLAGANIINRWSDSYKKLLYSSRIDTTKALVKAISNASKKPETFISTSAIGIYKHSKSHDEFNYEYENDFLSNLCQDWESEALKASEYDVRTIIFRFGIVLGEGGALEKMILPFKLGLGGIIGDGEQYVSFIHIDDLTKAYEFVFNHDRCEGIYNLTTPYSTTNHGFTKVLGRVLQRPTFIPVPKFMLSLIFGEGSKVLTHGQSVRPNRLLFSGFEFKFKTIEDAIYNLAQ